MYEWFQHQASFHMQFLFDPWQHSNIVLHWLTDFLSCGLSLFADQSIYLCTHAVLTKGINKRNGSRLYAVTVTSLECLHKILSSFLAQCTDCTPFLFVQKTLEEFVSECREKAKLKKELREANILAAGNCPFPLTSLWYSVFIWCRLVLVFLKLLFCFRRVYSVR